MELTVKNLKVRQINKDKLRKTLHEFVPINSNQEFVIEKMGVIIFPNQCFVTSPDCVFADIDKVINKNTKKYESSIPIGIRKKTITSEGATTPMAYEGGIYFTLSELEAMNLLDPEISLKEFMGSRYNYNPRIVNNTRVLLQEINN